MKPSGISEIILSRALRFLTDWENGAVTLDDCLDTLRKENGPERKAVASLLFEYFRHKGFIDSLIEKNARRGNVRQPMRLLLCCAVSQLLFQTGLARQSAVNIAVDHAKKIGGRGGGSFVNAMLRGILRDRSFDPGNIPPSFPETLRRRWTAAFGPETCDGIIRHFAVNPPLAFRARRELTPEMTEQLHAVPVTGLDFTGPFRFYETPDPAALFGSGLLDDASVYVQDPATTLVLSLSGTPPSGRVLDACAAPGGKTLLLADAAGESGVTLFACDRSPRRLLQLKNNLRRAGVRCRTAEADACELPYSDGTFDCVLADVPCSNTGVLRRRCDVPWRFTERALRDTVELQQRIMDSLAVKVKSGGLLLYSTCSIEREEDGEQAERFLVRHPDFGLVRDRLLLPGDHHDGAYAAMFRKHAGS